MFFEDPQQAQDSLARYIERDLTLRAHPDHSETRALFLALLRTYMEVGRLVPLEHLDDESQRLVPGRWHGFFSFVDSGPPGHRLQELLALHHVHPSGAGVERTFETEDGATVSSGKLVVESTAQVVDRAGAVQPTAFAAGHFTSAWIVGAFARMPTPCPSGNAMNWPAPC